MLARALIVLLIILNLGVALWWASRGEPPAPAPEIALPGGAEPLRLLDATARMPARVEMVRAAGPEAVPDAPAATAPDAGTVAEPAPAQAETGAVCRSFGPFEDAREAAEAEARLRPLVQSLSSRQVVPTARGWQVRMRALPDGEAAAAMVERLVAARFRDHYLMPTAADGTVDIALGRFGSEPAARRHQQALAAAGFDAVAEPLGGAGATRYWLDVALGADADPAAVLRASGAARSESLECGALAPR